MQRLLCIHSLLPLVLLANLVIGPAQSSVRADDPPAKQTEEKKATIAPPTAKELADKRIIFMKSALAHFTVQLGDRKERAKVGDPCLRWSNPLGTALDGIVAVYAYAGERPVALGKFFARRGGDWVNEFAIIPEGDVRVMRSDSLFWKPSEFVCKFADLPASPVPADKPALRLTQMRTLAADFSVISYYFGGDKHNLRLLTQPIYRYSEEGKIVDGCVFVFAMGTDAQCCLLLEAYKNDKESRYRYAIAPMSIFKLEARHKDTPVWNIEHRPTNRPARSYFAKPYVPEPGEELPAPSPFQADSYHSASLTVLFPPTAFEGPPGSPV